MDKIKMMSIDLETRSGADLGKTGVYRYAQDPSFDILLFGVSVDGSPVTVYDFAMGESVPDKIIRAVVDTDVRKYAHNASFERVCLSEWIRRNYPQYFRGYGQPGDPLQGYLDPVSWRCTMILCAYNGLPLSLEQAGSALHFEQQKLGEGRDLVRYFCTPSRTKDRDWNLPSHDPEKWQRFKEYNRRDVEVEMQLLARLAKYPVPDHVWEEYFLDQQINDRGIQIDGDLVEKAVIMDGISRGKLMAILKEKTGLENPNSVKQLKGFLAEDGMEMPSMGKKEVEAKIKDAPAPLADVLSLHLQLAKSSVKKYQAMQNAVCADSRCRGMFQFYGGSRSGRWAGRLVQLQNLPQNHMSGLEQARETLKTGDYELMEERYAPIPETLSELVRTAFVPAPGYRYIVADFSAIEARVLSYLAGEEWRTQVFRAGGDIYCASASQMFHVPVEKDGVNAHLRQKGKVAELALGYGGGLNALISISNGQAKLSVDELKPLVSLWRKSNKNIVRYWGQVDAGVKAAIRGRTYAKAGCVEFYWKSGVLFIRLPSGRQLAYIKPQITLNRYGKEIVTYLGLDTAKKWSTIGSYGPKFVENIVQAISRDILANAMMALSGYRIVGHVHDEVIIEAGTDVSVEEICSVMGRSPSWLLEICLRADGYECTSYRKS